MMLAGELAVAGIDVAIVERRASQVLDGSRSGGLHSPSRCSISAASPITCEREVTGFAQDDTGVGVELFDGQYLRADYLSSGVMADAA